MIAISYQQQKEKGKEKEAILKKCQPMQPSSLLFFAIKFHLYLFALLLKNFPLNLFYYLLYLHHSSLNLLYLIYNIFSFNNSLISFIYIDIFNKRIISKFS